MIRCIDANALQKRLERKKPGIANQRYTEGWNDCIMRVKSMVSTATTLENLPSADVAPVVHGRWIERQSPHAMEGISAKCSACSKNVQYLGNPLNYCPNCGAKMDGKE